MLRRYTVPVSKRGASPRALKDMKQEERTMKRLYRSNNQKMIAGVCGGIAEYLHVDPSIVRLITVVLVFGWGSGLLAYIICALVLPEE